MRSAIPKYVIRPLKRPAGIDIVRLSGIDGRLARRADEEDMAGTSPRRWIEGLKDPPFTAREIRVICAMFLCIAPIALGLALRFGRDLFPTLDVAGLGGDFPQFYVAGWLMNHHAPSRLYDLQLQSSLIRELCPVPSGVTLPFLYPPVVALIFRPFALLPYSLAFVSWSALSLGLYVVGLLVMMRRFGPVSRAWKETVVLLALAFEPFLVETLAGGQVSSIGFFCLALAIYYEQRARPFASGVCLSLCLYKPTLLVLLLPMLVVSRRWRILVGFSTGAGLLVAATVALVGPSVLMDYVTTMIRFGQLYLGRSGVLRGWKYVDVRSFATMLTGQYAYGLAVFCIAACLTLPLLVRVWLMSEGPETRYPATTWALTTTCTLLVNAYVPFYDCILVVLAFILIAYPPGGRLNEGHPAVLRWLALVTFVTAWGSQPVAGILGVQVFTLMLVLIAVYVAAVTIGTRHSRVVPLASAGDHPRPV